MAQQVMRYLHDTLLQLFNTTSAAIKIVVEGMFLQHLISIDLFVGFDQFYRILSHRVDRQVLEFGHAILKIAGRVGFKF